MQIDDFKRDFNKVKVACHYATWFYQCYWAIGGNAYEMYRNARAPYGFFFVACEEASIRAAVTTISQLFDKTKGCLTLKHLIKNAKALAEYTPEDIERFQQKEHELRPLYEKAEIIRHKLFAHLDAKMSSDEVWAGAAITPNNFRDLVRGCWTLLNDISNTGWGSQHMFDDRPMSCAAHLFEDIWWYKTGKHRVKFLPGPHLALYEVFVGAGFDEDRSFYLARNPTSKENVATFDKMIAWAKREAPEVWAAAIMAEPMKAPTL